MSKFTNGTWSVGIDEKYGPYVYANDGGAIIAVIRNCGHISESNEKEAVRQANAHLIAVAPDMYCLLKRLSECNHGDDMFDIMQDAQEIVARIDGVKAQS